MKVLVTGATGFTGSFTVPCLIEQGIDVRCLVRPTSDRSYLPDPRIEWVVGDLEDRQSLIRGLQGVDALVNIVSLGFGHAPNIVEAAVDAGIKRAIFISTTALFTTLNTPSKAVRLHAEQTIVQSGLDYTILRPTMIYGSSRDRNMCRLIRYLQRVPIIPIFGNGNHLQQPVYVDDVAHAIVGSLLVDVTVEKAYNISGAMALTYNAVIDTIGYLINQRTFRLHLPESPVIKGLQALKQLRIKMPISAEQVQRLNEEKAFDWADAHHDFDYAPHTFQEGIALELKELSLWR